MVNSIEHQHLKPLTCGYAEFCLLKQETFPTRRRLFQYLDEPDILVDKYSKGLDNPQVGPSYAQVSQQFNMAARAHLG